jgi:hypothetical protein
MTRMKIPSGGKLAFATVVATAMTAVPVAFGPVYIPQQNAALAQSDAAGSSEPGVAEERATVRADGTTVEQTESVYEILGTTREEAESADTHTQASAQYGQLDAYQTEVERGNLDAAAENLAAIAEDPITEDMVTEVNTELGVETTLTAKQIADAAARKQDDGDS